MSHVIVTCATATRQPLRVNTVAPTASGEQVTVSPDAPTSPKLSPCSTTPAAAACPAFPRVHMLLPPPPHVALPLSVTSRRLGGRVCNDASAVLCPSMLSWICSALPRTGGRPPHVIVVWLTFTAHARPPNTSAAAVGLPAVMNSTLRTALTDALPNSRPVITNQDPGVLSWH